MGIIGVWNGLIVADLRGKRQAYKAKSAQSEKWMRPNAIIWLPG